MKYDYFGRTGLRVSKLTLGTMNFGWKTPEDESFRIMDRALELGINFFDTADVYDTEQFNGEAGHPGLTEEFLGHWMQVCFPARSSALVKMCEPQGPKSACPKPSCVS